MAYIIRNNVKYAGGSGSGGNTDSVDLTMAEYLELEKNGQVVEDTTYYITDESVGNEIDAELVMFDDTNTQMGVDNVQDAVENINTQVSELNKKIPNMLYGKIEPSSIAGNNGKNVTITFEKAFNEVPSFLCNFFIDSETSAPIIRNSVLKITKEYAIVRIANDGTSSYNIGLSWLAIGN